MLRISQATESETLKFFTSLVGIFVQETAAACESQNEPKLQSLYQVLQGYLGKVTQ